MGGAGSQNAAVPGTTIRGIVVLRIATGITPTTGTTISVFGLSASCRALFCTRAGGWEFTWRVEEESRPVPVMLFLWHPKIKRVK